MSQGSAPAPEVLSEYEKRNLRIQWIGLLVQAITLFGGVFSVWILFAQVKEQTKATNAQYEVLDLSVYQDLMSKQLELDQLFVEKPHLYDQIFGKRRDPKEKIPADVLNAAYYHLDFFQLAFTQRTRLPKYRGEDDPAWKMWKNTMASTFQESPLLCDQLALLQEMYGPDFVSYVLKEHDWCKRALPNGK